MSEPEVDLQAILDQTAPEAPAPEAPAEPTPEAAPPAAEAAEPEAPAADSQFESSWAAIKAAEKRNLTERQAIKEQKSQMAQLQSQLDEAQGRVSHLEGGFKEDPLQFLERHGIEFEDLAKRVINDGAPSSAELVKRESGRNQSEIAKLREEHTKLQELVQNQNNERLVRDYKTEVSKVLKEDRFELLHSYPGAMDLVFNLASNHAAENEEVLTPEQAAVRIQGELEVQLKTLAKSPSVQRLLAAETAAPEAPNKAPSPTATTTLTNQMAATPPANLPDTSNLSEYELLAQAAKLLPANVWENID